jgi:hypothetical protein
MQLGTKDWSANSANNNVGFHRAWTDCRIRTRLLAEKARDCRNFRVLYLFNRFEADGKLACMEPFGVSHAKNL